MLQILQASYQDLDRLGKVYQVSFHKGESVKILVFITSPFECRLGFPVVDVTPTDDPGNGGCEETLRQKQVPLLFL